MKKGKIAIFLTILMISTILPLTLFVDFGVGSTISVSDPEMKDIGPELRKMSLPDRSFLSGMQELEAALNGYHEPGAIVDFFVYDYYPDDPFYPGYPVEVQSYVFEYETANGEVWVQCDENGDHDLGYLPGDPRNDPTFEDGYYLPVVTDEQIMQLGDEFENNILPTTTSYFGEPDTLDGYWSWNGQHTGSNKSIILVSNIRDDWFYDIDLPYFVAGFFWTFYEFFIDRNIISIDCHDWANRVGPTGGARAYEYEGLIAHEYQHLIHSDYLPGDDTFMNEGCSMFAEIVCGYSEGDWDSINSFLATPDNSLTDWEDQGGLNILADYGQVQLWATYLVDRFGADFLSDFLAGGITGVAGLEALFAPLTFNEVFHDWRIANLIQAKCGKYGYKTIDFDSEEAKDLRVYDIDTRTVPWTTGADFGNTLSILGIDTGEYKVGPWGTDYISFSKLKRLNKLVFDGDDTVPFGWQINDAGNWYSGSGNSFDHPLSCVVDVDLADPTLTITTSWDIEGWWDFGFIQVYDPTHLDATAEGWVSLGNLYTEGDDLAGTDPAIAANLPGLTSWSGYYDVFDGNPDGWITMDFDLGDWAGETVELQFRYMTDAYVMYPGWEISEVFVSGQEVTDFTFFPPHPTVDFMVSLIYEYSFKICGKQFTFYYVDDDLVLDVDTEIGEEYIYAFGKPKVYMLVSPIETTGDADYGFEISKVKFKCWCR